MVNTQNSALKNEENEEKRCFFSLFPKNIVTILLIFLSMIVEADKLMNLKESYHGKKDFMF